LSWSDNLIGLGTVIVKAVGAQHRRRSPLG
jgi:hypothetical protein